MNVLKLEENRAVFEGFPLFNDGKHTLKKLGNKIVLEAKVEEKRENNYIFITKGHICTDKEFLSILKEMKLKNKNIFVEVSGDYYFIEYLST